MSDDKRLLDTFMLILGALVAIALIIWVLAQSLSQSEEDAIAQDPAVIASTKERIRPVGQVSIAGQDKAPTASADDVADGDAAATEGGSKGEQVYNQACVACHGTGVAGAPTAHDEAVWEARVAQGTDTLYDHAIHGFTGNAGMMPAKGGRSDLSDDDVRAAVDYMLPGGDAATADSPAAEDAAASTSAPETAPASEAEQPAEEQAAVESGIDGQEIYNQACIVCHGAGIAGAPKVGDSANWAPRVAQGMDTVYGHAINGYQGSAGMMPAKGGRVDLSDDTIKAAVDYMVENSQ